MKKVRPNNNRPQPLPRNASQPPERWDTAPKPIPRRTTSPAIQRRAPDEIVEKWGPGYEGLTYEEAHAKLAQHAKNNNRSLLQPTASTASDVRQQRNVQRHRAAIVGVSVGISALFVIGATAICNPALVSHLVHMPDAIQHFSIHDMFAGMARQISTWTSHGTATAPSTLSSIKPASPPAVVSIDPKQTLEHLLQPGNFSGDTAKEAHKALADINVSSFNPRIGALRDVITSLSHATDLKDRAQAVQIEQAAADTIKTHHWHGPVADLIKSQGPWVNHLLRMLSHKSALQLG